jgi:hypothetical protein
MTMNFVLYNKNKNKEQVLAAILQFNDKSQVR